MLQAPAKIGDNSPPNDAVILQERLREAHAELLDHAMKLCESAERVPPSIQDGDEATAGKVTDLIRMITGTVKNLEAKRVAEKEPFLSQGRAVDGFFKFATDKLEAAKRRANGPIGDFLRRKEAKERSEREEAARKLREQQEEEARAAALLQQANLKPEAEALADQAAITAHAAAKAEVAAVAKPSELARTRSAEGGTASLRTRWVGELVDQKTLDLEKLRHHLPSEALQKAINSFVAAGGRELAGARIMEKTDAVVR